MNCRQAEELLQLRLDGDLNESGRRVIEAHLGECSDCVALCDELCALETWARALPTASPSPDFADRVMAHLDDEPEAAVVDESIAIGLPLAVTAVIAGIALPILLVIARTVAAWYAETASAANEYVSTTAADLSSISRDLSESVTPLWSSLPSVQSYLPGLSLTAVALTAFALALAFNIFQFRGELVRAWKV